MSIQSKKAREFAEALRKWDVYKVFLKQLLAAGRITEEQELELLKQKAHELDL